MFEREKSALLQIEKAREAIRSKHMMLKHGKACMEKVRDETLKPIVDPLEKLVNIATVSATRERKERESSTPLNRKVFDVSNSSNESNVTAKFIDTSDAAAATDDDDTLQAAITDGSMFETAESESESPEAESSINKFLVMLRTDRKKYIDNIYGVRILGNMYMLGNAPIHFTTDHIKVRDVSYTKTDGLLELLFKRDPDKSLIEPQDLQNYRKIIEITNAHRRNYCDDEPLRRSNSKKYNNYIAPMFDPSNSKSGRGLLPPYKIARKGATIDYVHWDDPNELVDRLRLLVAEKSAGNFKHINEIYSIIEELREAGYIY